MACFRCVGYGWYAQAWLLFGNANIVIFGAVCCDEGSGYGLLFAMLCACYVWVWKVCYCCGSCVIVWVVALSWRSWSLWQFSVFIMEVVALVVCRCQCSRYHGLPVKVACCFGECVVLLCGRPLLVAKGIIGY